MSMTSIRTIMLRIPTSVSSSRSRRRPGISIVVVRKPALRVVRSLFLVVVAIGPVTRRILTRASISRRSVILLAVSLSVSSVAIVLLAGVAALPVILTTAVMIVSVASFSPTVISTIPVMIRLLTIVAPARVLELSAWASLSTGLVFAIRSIIVPARASTTGVLLETSTGSTSSRTASPTTSTTTSVTAIAIWIISLTKFTRSSRWVAWTNFLDHSRRLVRSSLLNLELVVTFLIKYNSTMVLVDLLF
mmetsp:Transcript_7325/g.13493  ORF Transcript_7325/g.13493 Transcript_7325/m.13493 type:complete len:248 (+) Transcript_7325:261-1004(+)